MWGVYSTKIMSAKLSRPRRGNGSSWSLPRQKLPYPIDKATIFDRNSYEVAVKRKCQWCIAMVKEKFVDGIITNTRTYVVSSTSFGPWFVMTSGQNCPRMMHWCRTSWASKWKFQNETSSCPNLLSNFAASVKWCSSQNTATKFFLGHHEQSNHKKRRCFFVSTSGNASLRWWNELQSWGTHNFSIKFSFFWLLDSTASSFSRFENDNAANDSNVSSSDGMNACRKVSTWWMASLLFLCCFCFKPKQVTSQLAS